MPHTFVILGASGDLTHRKLVPALYHLYRKKRLPPDTRIVGFSRSPFTHDAWRSDLAKAVARFVGNDFDAGLWDRFSQNIYYHAGDIGRSEDFTTLAQLLNKIEKGENLVVLGKSGSGKSVLIKCLVGLVEPDDGTIFLLGKDISELTYQELNVMRKKIGFLFERYPSVFL